MGTEKFGKLDTAAELAVDCAADYPVDSRKHRLFVLDKHTGLRYLIDSGADISSIPATKHDKISNDYKLYAANGTEIPTYGIKVLTIDLGLRRSFQWPFIIAKINKGIIGADFLNNFKLVIDINKRKLIDGVTNLSIQGEITSISEETHISTMKNSSKYHELMSKYAHITQPNLFTTNIKHDVKHQIITEGRPVYCKPRQLDPQRLKIAKQEFQYMLNNNILRPSSSQWASPLHLVMKKDGSFRPCGDYRKLNASTIPDRYPIPRLNDFNHILKNSKIFSKIDLLKAYFQIPIAEEDKPKTAIITPFGLFEFNFMSFGLRNAPATFQRFIHQVFQNLDFVFPYIDDILIASSSEEEHQEHLKLVFDRLNEYGLRINLSKSIFGVHELEFLGYLITPDGACPLPEKVEAIMKYKLPNTIQELRTFLGMINFYRPFIKDAANIQANLHEYLKGAKKKDQRKIQWTDDAIQSFEKCKEALSKATLLSYPNPELPLSLYTDASDWAIGSVLQQYENDKWKPIAFYSKKLNDAQKNYSTYDRELLGIYFSIKQFKHLLEGRNFVIYTDHKPITFAFRQKNEKASPRQFRQLQYISQFSTDIRHISGQQNIVADALSRNENAIIDYEKIAECQNEDNDLEQLRKSDNSLNLRKHELPSKKELWCDTSTSFIRPFIPQKFRRQVFEQIHGLAHPGIKRTVKQITSKFIWPNMRRDIQTWARTCIDCQKNKITRHTKSEFSKFEESNERFNIVHIDLIGPLPPSDSKVYCLTCIDRFTSWMEVIPIENINAETIAKAFYNGWISRFGVPSRLITDRGSQFLSEVMQQLTKICGVKIQHTTAYHPQSNGRIERLHRTLKTALKSQSSAKWSDTLPTVLLGLRAAIQEVSNSTIAQMVYGQSIRLPGEFFCESKFQLPTETFVSKLQKHMELLRPKPMQHKCRQTVFVHKDLKTCNHVFIRVDRVKKQLESPYDGPFRVIARSEKYFTILIKNKNVTVSIDRLKPAYILADDCELKSTKTVPDTASLPKDDSKPKQVLKKTRFGRPIILPARFRD